jgi:L-alanine-DL-glutamate epimerase-like enolase superfamily enzyme
VKIVAVEVHKVYVPAPEPPFIWRRGLTGSPPAGYSAVLVIRTDTGCDGVAFAARQASSAVLPDIVDRYLRELLIGEDPLQREWLWHKVWELDRVEEIPLYLLGTVDIALWDLAGRAYGAPTWEVLGGARREIPAYASTTTFGSVEEYLEIADQCLELGYPAIKLHAFGDAREDARLCTALRHHVGDALPLMYDGSAGFDLPDAVYLGHALADAGYLWYEEPLREFSVTSYKWLAQRTAAPLLVGETSDGAHMNTADFIASGCASFVRTSAELRGGFTGAMRTAHMADAFRLRAEPHGNTITCRHLCMAIPNCTYYESLVWGNPVRREAGIDQHGMIKAPLGPGVGLPAGPDYPEALEEFVVHL